MKKGICMGSLPGDMPVAEKLKLAKDAGFDGVEPGVLATDDALNEVKQAAAAGGV